MRVAQKTLIYGNTFFFLNLNSGTCIDEFPGIDLIHDKIRSAK